MPRVTINGIDTYYEVHGEGAPLLYFRGGYGGITSSVGVEVSRPSSAIFGEAVQVIDYHRRCEGLSEYDLTPFTFDDLARDADALIQHIGAERVVVAGVSAGGPLALQFVLSHPERVMALVLACTGSAIMSTHPYEDMSTVPPAIEARIEEVNRRMKLVTDARAEGETALFERLRDRLRNPRSRAEPGSAAAAREEAFKAKLQDVSDDDLKTYFTGELRHMAANEEVNLSSRMHEITVPTLIVHGTADKMVPPQYGHDLARAIPNARIVEIEGAGHNVVDDPRAKQVIQDWLAEVTASVAPSA